MRAAGLAFDPMTSGRWETGNGPACNDELNRIFKGLNYGWVPSRTCSTPPAPPSNTNQDGPSPVIPAAFYTPPPALTGVAFCSGWGLGPSSENALFPGTFNTRRIRQVELASRARHRVASEIVAYTHPSSVLSLERAPTAAFTSATRRVSTGSWRASAPWAKHADMRTVRSPQSEEMR